MLRAWHTFVVCALLACACPGAPTPDAGAPDFCQPAGDLTLLDEPELYLDEAATVHLAGRFARCDGGELAAPAQVQVELSDPDDHSVPVTVDVHSMPYRDDDGGLGVAFGDANFDGGTLVLADVSFQPGQLGLHHLTARFQPSLGTLQAEVMVMIDVRGPRKTSAVAAPCTWFDVWNGLELCVSYDSNVNYGTLSVSRDGAAVFERRVFNALPSDAGLWSVDPDGRLSLIDFFDDGGTAVRASGALPASLVSNPAPVKPQLAADDGQLLLFSGNSVFVARPGSDGGITFAGGSPLPVYFDDHSAGLLRADEGAALGGTQSDATASSLCLVTFTDGGVSCTTGPMVMGADQGTLWSLDLPTGQLSACSLAAGPAITCQTASFRDGTQLNGNSRLDQSLFSFASQGASGGSSVGTLFSVSRDQVWRVPVQAAHPELDGFGRFPPPQVGAFGGASTGCVWQYLPATQEVLYQQR